MYSTPSRWSVSCWKITAVNPSTLSVVSAPLAVEVAELKNFFSAEEYHQKYLEKNPGGYCHIPQRMFRLNQNGR